MGHKGWVLVTAGSRRRASVEAVRGLAAGGYRAAVTVSGPSLAAASRHCARRVVVPPVTDPGYASAVRAELDSGGYLTVLPASDPALLALDAPGADLADKVMLEKRAERAGFEMPPSRYLDSPEELHAAAPNLEYPVVVKPTVRRYFPRRIDSPGALRSFHIDEGPVLVQPYLSDPLLEVSGVMWKGRLVAVSHQRCLRVWPLDCGTVTAAVTVVADETIERRLPTLLEGYDGIFQTQFLGNYLLDLNTMVHTSMPLALAAGVNLVAIYCDLLRGEDVVAVRSRPGLFYRWLEGDLRALFKEARVGRLRAWEALRAALPHRGAAHSIESLTDPGPMLARFWHGAVRGRL